MLEAEVVDMGCPEMETLAAFVDGRLEPEARRAIMAHLADCEACYEVVTETLHTEEEFEEEDALPAPVVQMPRRHWGRWVGVAAAAALLVAVIPTLLRTSAPAFPAVPVQMPPGWETPGPDPNRGGVGEVQVADDAWQDLRLGALLADVRLAVAANDPELVEGRLRALRQELRAAGLDSWVHILEPLDPSGGLEPDLVRRIEEIDQEMQAEFEEFRRPALRLGRWAQLGRFAALAGDRTFLESRTWRRELRGLERSDLPREFFDSLRGARQALEEGTNQDLVQVLDGLLSGDGGSV